MPQMAFSGLAEFGMVLKGLNLRTKPLKTIQNKSKPQKTICCISKPEFFSA